MDSLLTDWLAGAEIVETRDEASVSEIRRRVRLRAGEAGLPTVAGEQLSLAASELGHNQLRHGRGGSIAIRAVERDGEPGLELVAADTGPGIVDPATALRGRAGSLPAGGSLGVGLSGAVRQVDEADFDVRLGEGTAIWARKLARPVGGAPLVGIYGRAIPGELEMADAAAFRRADGVLTLAVADGVGHGPEARAAALGAVRVAMAEAARGPAEALVSADVALVDSRGAVMTVVSIDERAGSLEVAAVGNVVARLCRPRASQAFRGESRVLGQRGGLGPRGGRRKVTVERADLQPGDVVMLFTDGLRSRANLAEELALMREHPIVMAHHLFQAHARGHDDALVAVIRL